MTHLLKTFPVVFSKLVPKSFFAGTFLIGTIFFLMGYYYPLDDFYRHLVASFYGFNPFANYPQSFVTHYSQYPLFEYLLSILTNRIGLQHTIFVLEAFSFAVSYWLFYALALKQLEEPHSELIASQLALLFLSVISFRMISLRPEYFVFIIFSSLFLERDLLKSKIIWFTPLCSFGYWLVPLWLPLILFHPDSLKRKLLLIFILSIIHFSFWQWYSGNDWVYSIVRWANFSDNRLAPLGELKNFWSVAIFSTWIWPLAYFGWLGWDKGRINKESVIVYILYNVLGYARLAGAFLLGVLPFIVKGAKQSEFFIKKPWLSYGFCVAVFIGTLPHNPIALFKLPKGATVLAEGSSAYTLNLDNPGTIAVLPSFETGASPKTIQKMILDIPKMQLNCNELYQFKINYIVEQSAKAVPPSCLTLSNTYGPWRLWKVTPTQI